MHRGRRHVLLIFACAALTAGCTSGRPPLVTPPGSALPPPAPPAPSVPYDTLRKIMEAYAERKRWSKKGTGGEVYVPKQIDRHRGFFARRRTLVHAVANPGWISEAGFNQLFTRLDAEVAAVESYLTTKTAAIIDATDGPPTHLDLTDLAKVKTTTPAARIRHRKTEYLGRRKRRMRAIVWGAAGIHAELWEPGGGTPTIRTAALDQVLDMRLRMVERLNFQVSSAAALVEKSDQDGQKLMRHNNKPQGPWEDGFRVRMFEYPRIPAFLAGVVGAANIADPDAPAGVVKDWQWEDAAKERLHWIHPGDGGVRLEPTTVDPDWTGRPNRNRYLRSAAAGGPAAAMDRLFTSSQDWWSRSWLFCDHVIAALQIEGLRFALRRRFGNDTDFDALPARAAPSYVVLTASMGGDRLPSFGVMMNDIPGDPYFDKLFALEGDLQVGDHLVMWNSFLYSMVSNGEWRLENALVTDVDGDPITGSFDRSALAMQGHGTGERHYTRYQDTIARQTQAGVLRAQKAINDAVTNNAAVPEVALHKGAKAVRWDAYEAFAKPGAWWVRVPVPDTSDLKRWQTVSEALTALPKSLADQAPAVGPGYNAPPLGGLTAAVFFPLFEPKMPSGNDPGWPGYFAARRNGPSASLPKKLEPVKVDGSMCPGLFFKGGSTQIPIIRPRVKL